LNFLSDDLAENTFTRHTPHGFASSLRFPLRNLRRRTTP
jgi:hypothetical protein